MASVKGMWVAVSQQKIGQDGEIKYIEQIYYTPPEAEHVRRIVLADLQNDFFK